MERAPALQRPKYQVLSTDYRHATPARIAATGQLARLGIARHRLNAAEVQVALGEAVHLVPLALERVELLRVHARLGLDHAVLVVDAWPVHRLLRGQRAVDHAE